MRAMFDLAASYGQGPVSVTTVAQRQHLTVPYLEQLLNRLRRHGLIESVRGPKGGYLLAKAPEVITVGEIVRALEGAPDPMFDGNGKRHKDAPASHYVTGLLWQRLGATISEALKTTSLQDLCDEARFTGYDLDGGYAEWAQLLDHGNGLTAGLSWAYDMMVANADFKAEYRLMDKGFVPGYFDSDYQSNPINLASVEATGNAKNGYLAQLDASALGLASLKATYEKYNESNPALMADLYAKLPTDIEARGYYQLQIRKVL